MSPGADGTAVLTLEEARSYARDWESSDEEMSLFIAAAGAYISAAVGDSVSMGDPRVKLLAGMLVADMDDVRETTQGGGSAEGKSRRELVRGLICQLRTEGLG